MCFFPAQHWNTAGYARNLEEVDLPQGGRTVLYITLAGAQLCTYRFGTTGQSEHGGEDQRMRHLDRKAARRAAPRNTHDALLMLTAL